MRKHCVTWKRLKLFLTLSRKLKKNLICVLVVFFISLEGCGENEKETIVVAFTLKLESNADLLYEQMVLDISFEPQLNKGPSEKDGDSDDDGRLVKRKEDIRLPSEFEINLRYLNLERSEDSLAYNNKAKLDARAKKELGERLRVSDKKLIFGGKGFDTNDFEKFNEGKLSGEFSSHINPQRSKSLQSIALGPVNLNQKLNPEDKNLIFHISSSTLNGQEVSLQLPGVQAEKMKEKSLHPRKY
jgi:hypothetical protein